jgi:hypothetical protein
VARSTCSQDFTTGLAESAAGGGVASIAGGMQGIPKVSSMRQTSSIDSLGGLNDKQRAKISIRPLRTTAVQLAAGLAALRRVVLWRVISGLRASRGYRPRFVHGPELTSPDRCESLAWLVVVAVLVACCGISGYGVESRPRFRKVDYR